MSAFKPVNAMNDICKTYALLHFFLFFFALGIEPKIQLYAHTSPGSLVKGVLAI
jgi:hypothetical protein